MAVPLIPAAQYLRMSTEDQKYSISNQEAVIAEYAQSHRYQIVATFSDPGISGLDLKHRPGLKALLNAAVTGSAPFTTILVLDVSRWGRFQDIDESAHYEFVCREAGVRVQYCAEPFENDSTAYSNLVKAIKRTMAAEYSRELGNKVVRGQKRLASLGYKQGGRSRVGLRRLLIDQNDMPKQLLHRGERKALITDRVILIPGPPKEIAFVRSLFNAVAEGQCINHLVQKIGKRKRFGRYWDHAVVVNLLRNPQYAGTYVFNRLSTRLNGKLVKNPSDQWVVRPGTVTPIVSTELFERVQERIANMTVRLSNDELLKRLRQLWADKGRLSRRLVDESRAVPSPATFAKRFGQLTAAYRLIGYPTRDETEAKKIRIEKLRHSTWRGLRASLLENHIKTRFSVRNRYDIRADGLPIFDLIFAHPLPSTKKERGPLWRVRIPHPRPNSRCIIATLSEDKREIREFLVCRPLRKKPVRRLVIDLPTLAKIALTRFLDPSQFFAAIKAVGYAE